MTSCDFNPFGRVAGSWTCSISADKISDFPMDWSSWNLQLAIAWGWTSNDSDCHQRKSHVGHVFCCVSASILAEGAIGDLPIHPKPLIFLGPKCHETINIVIVESTDHRWVQPPTNGRTERLHPGCYRVAAQVGTQPSSILSYATDQPNFTVWLWLATFKPTLGGQKLWQNKRLNKVLASWNIIISSDSDVPS